MAVPCASDAVAASVAADPLEAVEPLALAPLRPAFTPASESELVAADVRWVPPLPVTDVPVCASAPFCEAETLVFPLVEVEACVCAYENAPQSAIESARAKLRFISSPIRNSI